MLSDDNGWAVGHSGSTSVVLHWNGSEWKSLSDTKTLPRKIYSSGSALKSVYMLSDRDGWIVGRDLFRWNGQFWIKMSNPTSKILWSIYMSSSTVGWAVGSGGTILKWDGAQWNSIESPTTEFIFTVYGDWAAGHTGLFLKWDGNKWEKLGDIIADTKLARFSQDIKSIDFCSEEYGCAVGINGAIYHWAKFVDEAYGWRAIHGTDKTIGRTREEILKFPLEDLTDAHINSVALISPSEGWAVGGGGLRTNSVILNWDGIKWKKSNCPVDVELHSISMVSSSVGWAVGERGTIIKYA